jgi:S1-C subfamily serine protease
MTSRSLLLCIVAIGIARPASAGPEDSVVKIFATVRFPNTLQPWVRGQPTANFGTGVVIEGNRILTNLHLVHYGTEIYIEDRQAGGKVEAKLQAICIDSDLALLTLSDDKFFKNHAVLPRAPKLPAVQDRVAIYGFPIGGNGLSITRGEVSRIEYGNYGRGFGPVIQVSAPVNPGNSGGPAVVDDKMIGVVVSRLVNAQNIGTIIPNEEIESFLGNLKRGPDQGKPAIAMQVIVQALENKALRRKLHLDDSVHGVLVQSVGSNKADSLRPADVVTKIGDFPIDDTGTIRVENGMRAPYIYALPQVARNDAAPFTVLRKGKELVVSVPVASKENRLVRSYNGEPTSYFIHGPLVFAVARLGDLTTWAQVNRTLYLDNSPLVTRADDLVRFSGEELVVVSSPMFSHPIAKGYLDPIGKTLKDVNGVAVKNLRHLVEQIRDSKEEFLTFRFADDYSEMLVFDRMAMNRATDEVLEDNGIPTQRRGSTELLKIWKSSSTEK